MRRSTGCAAGLVSSHCYSCVVTRDGPETLHRGDARQTSLVRFREAISPRRSFPVVCGSMPMTPLY